MRAARSLFLLLALAVPVLAGYVIYEQARTPVFDAVVDLKSGEILDVERNSFANWAGFWPGDVILSINGEPFPQFPAIVGNYPAEVLRGGETLTLEMPWVPLAKVNLPSLLSGAAVALVFWASGLLLLLRRYEQAEIRLLFLLSQTLAVAILFPMTCSSWPLPAWEMDLSVACLFVSAPLLLHHHLTFPARLGNRRVRAASMGILYALALGMFFLWLTLPALGRRFGMAYTACVVAAAMGALGFSYFRRASADDRRRLRLVFFGSLLGALPALLFFFLPSLFDAQRIPLWLAGLFTVAAPLSYLYAILRHNLFGIDRLLNRVLVYIALSLGILILYLGPFLLIYRFAPGDWLAQAMTASGLTLVVGLAFERTRTTLQRLVDRLFYGGWYDYPAVVEQASRALAACTDRAQLTNILLHQTPALMQLQGCGLTFDAGRIANSTCALQFPLSFQGQTRALWSVGSHRDGDDLTESDRRILETLARQAEIALGNVLLIETLRAQLDEIRASRETLARLQGQLIHSREEERARLARDLHDGPLQALIGLNMQLGLLAAQSGDSAALNEMRAEVRGLLAELRAVCAELRPPMLDTLGLVAAIRSLAEEWAAQNNVKISLDLPPGAACQSLPGEVAVNLYRVTQEALANIARHAQAKRAGICLTTTNEGLRLTVEDDGCGFVPPPAIHDLAAQGHFGLAGLQERVHLIGGTFALASAPGQGTRLCVCWRSPE